MILVLLVLYTSIFAQQYECKFSDLRNSDGEVLQLFSDYTDISMFIEIKNETLIAQTAVNRDEVKYDKSFPTDGGINIDVYFSKDVVYSVYKNFEHGVRMIADDIILDLVNCKII